MGMTYTKANDGNGLKYTDMCIYIDKVMKDWSPDHPLTQEEEENVYKYIYLLYYALSCKKHYFSSVEDYDSYSLYCATKAYVRLIDPRQFNIVDGKPEMERVKSILNYVKATLFGWKIYWQKENFVTIIDQEHNKTFDPVTFQFMLQDNVNSTNKGRVMESIFDDINDVPSILKRIISELPYSKDRIMSDRLYIASLLTFIKSIDAYRELKNVEKYYNTIDATNLWRLDESMEPTVKLIFNKLKDELKDNIHKSYARYDISEDELISSLWDIPYNTQGAADE